MPAKDPQLRRDANNRHYQRHSDKVKQKASEYRASKKLSSDVSDEELDRRAMQWIEQMRSAVTTKVYLGLKGFTL